MGSTVLTWTNLIPSHTLWIYTKRDTNGGVLWVDKNKTKKKELNTTLELRGWKNLTIREKDQAKNDKGRPKQEIKGKSVRGTKNQIFI